MIGEIDRQITERVKFPIVSEVYEEWKKKGLLEETVKIIGELPDTLAEPIVHSFTTHVHKEKGLFVYLIAEELGLDSHLAKPLAVSGEILWALALMMDDIQDEDLTRGGVESCWAKFGRERTEQSAYLGLNALMKYIEAALGDSVARKCMKYVDMGFRSLEEHKQMGLDTPHGVILRNYERRCDFHGIFQLDSIFGLKNTDPLKQSKLVSGLRYYYRGGQLINDLKDLLSGDLYGRAYSDIRNGVPTIPLLDMYTNLQPQRRGRLKEIFGKRVVSADEHNEIARMVKESGIIVMTIRIIKDSYSTGLRYLAEILSPNRFEWFQKWATYKTDFLNKYEG